MNDRKKTVLLLSLADFDRGYQYHKEMGSGVGFKSVRPVLHHAKPRRIYPIAELQYAAAIVKEAGYPVIIDDDQYRDSVDPEAYKSALKSRCESPCAIFVRTSLPTLLHDLEQVDMLHTLYPGIPLYIFGPLFSASEFVDFVKQKKLFDGVITSEIEAVILDVIEHKNPDKIPGFYYLKNDSYHSGNLPRALTDMQTLPMPAYECVDHSKIDRFIVQTSRGCPMACNYCPYYLSQGHKFRAKTSERAFEEIKYLREEFGARRIIIHDPIFTLDKKRVIKLCELLADANLDIEWECETHMAHLDPSMIELMYKAGLRILAFGVESANEEVLKQANRRFKNWKLIKENIQIAKKIGVETRAYYILALPGDTIEGAYATIELAKYLHPDFSKFNLPNPYPGTGLYNNALAEGWLDREKFENDRDAFYRELGVHGTDEPSMTLNISDLQAQYLSRVGNHEVLLQHLDGLKKFPLHSKILAYKTAVHGIGALRQLGLNIG